MGKSLKEKQIWNPRTIWLQNLLSSYTDEGSMVLIYILSIYILRLIVQNYKEDSDLYS